MVTQQQFKSKTKGKYKNSSANQILMLHIQMMRFTRETRSNMLSLNCPNKCK